MTEVRFIAFKNFTDSLKTAATFIPRRASREIAQNVLLTFDHQLITIRATNMLTTYERTISTPALDAHTPFSILLDRKVAQSIKNRMPVVFAPDHCVIDFQTYTQLADPKIFPDPPKTETAHDVDVLPQYFSDLVTCAKSAASSESRPTLLGVSHRGSALCATDGLRLCDIKQPNLWPKDFIVPAHITSTLASCFPSGAVLQLADDYVRYANESTQITLRLIDGTFPDVGPLFKANYSASPLPIHAEHWTTALNKITAFYRALSKKELPYLTPVSMSVNGESCVLTTQTVNGANAQVEISLPGNERAFHATANTEKLLTAIKQVGESTLLVDDSSKPLFFTSVDGRTRALVSQIHIRKAQEDMQK